MGLDLTEITKVVTDCQRASADIHLHPEKHLADRSVVSKDKGTDYTTAVDIAVEKYIQETLRQYSPEIGFLGEETGRESSAKKRLFWIVDPTDGTAVYTTGGEYYSNSIALANRQEQKVIFGSVYQPATGRQFLRVDGGEPWLTENIVDRDGRESTIERKPIPSQSKGAPELMGCAFGASKHYGLVPGIKEKLEKVFEKTKYPSLNREYGMIDARPASGSSALFCCDIADGNRHFALLSFQKAWDLAVGALYAKDAGCIVECGDSVGTFTGGKLEEQIATCEKDTLINVGVFANQRIKNEVMERFNA